MLNTRTAVTAVLAQVLAQVLVIPAALNPIGVRKRREKKEKTPQEKTPQEAKEAKDEKKTQEAPICDRGRYQA